MLKYFVFLLASITTLISKAQYTQSIDTLTRKELRQLLIDQPYSQKAKDLTNLSKGLDFFSVLGYSVGTATLVSGLTHTKRNDQDADGALLIAFGAMINVATAIIFNGSAAYFRGRAKKAYLQSIPIGPSSSSRGKDMNLTESGNFKYPTPH